MPFIRTFLAIFRTTFGKNVLIIILSASVIFSIRSCIRGQNKAIKKIPISTLFQKIEYLEELKLVSYYYEEIVTVGTTDPIALQAQQAEEDFKDAIQAQTLAKAKEARLKEQLEAAIRLTETTDTTINRLKNDIEVAKERLAKYKTYANTKFKKASQIEKFLDNNPAGLGLRVRQSFAEYQITRAAFKAARRNSDRRKKKAIMEKAEDKLVKLVGSFKDSVANKSLKADLKRELDSVEVVFKQMQKAVKKKYDRYWKQRNEASKVYRRAVDAAGKTDKKRTEAEEKWSQAKDLASLNEDNFAPQLLVIVSAQVTGKINLQGLEFDVIGDSLTITKMPKPELDSVQIYLEDAENYQLVNDLNLFGGKSKADFGEYYELYSQLKEGLKKTSKDVLEKAEKGGIRGETNKLAKKYITDIGKSLGFKVRFQDESPEFNGYSDLSTQQMPAPNSLSPNFHIEDSLQKTLDSIKEDFTDSVERSLEPAPEP